MRKFNKITKKIAVAAAGFATLFAVAACSDVGLGHAVDTIAPTVDITYPPAAAIVRDSFILAGTWTDDNAVTSINITVENIDSKESFNVPATINQDKTWQVEINGYDDEKKCFSLIDGTYQLNAIGTDAAGRKSGVASRQFEIDNSAPLFVVSNPGVVKKSGKSPSSYGSFFNIVGRIAEAHDVASMNLDVFDGNTDEKLNSEVYIEKGIQTAGGTDVTIAAFNYAADTDAKRRFSQIYGTEDTLGTKNYYCSVDLYDSAKAFKNPKETERSAEDDLGNHTTEIYLFDEVNSDLVSPTKGLGYSYTQLMQIKNGTLVDKNSEAVLEILKKRSRNTEKADERLYFSLNPLANPTYTINGFAYDFGEGKQLQSASSGNSLSITLQAGLDGNNIDPSVAKVWLLSLDERPYDSNVIRSKIKNLETQVNSSDLDPESGESYKVCEYDGAGKPTGTVIEGWGLIYNNADYNGSSVSQTTFSVKLPESSIKLNKYYFVAVTGCDVEDVFFSIDAQNTFFGFEGNEAGIAPTVEIKSPANQSIVSASDAENLKFTGKVYVNSESIYAQKFDVKIVAKDESDNSEVGTVEAKISRNDPSGEWTSSDAVAIDSDGNWTIVPEKFEGYSKIAAAKDSGKSYLYTLEITAESSSGHNITVSSMVKIDAVAPVVTITSLTPTVSGAEYYAGAPESDPRTKKIFVNGNISITGNIVETNLKNVRYDVWARVVGTGNGEVLSEKDSVLKAIEDYLIYKGDLGKVFSKTVELPTNAITWHFAKEDNTDPEIEFEVVIYAEDECGNSGEFHTSQLNEGEYYVIKQETDKPVITLGNSSNSELFASGASNINEINGNLFGTTSNNKLSISFADDDSIKEYIVTIYNEAGEKIGEDKLGEGVESNPLTIPSGKTSASLNYVLPAIEGVYQIEIQAKDGKYLKKEADGTWKYEDGSGFVNNTEEEVKKLNENRLSTTEKYFIAVSKGAPKVTITTTKAYLSATPTISGTVESSAKKITAVFINPETEEVDSQPATVQPVINGTSWTYTIPSASSLNNASYAIKFTSEDAYGQKDSSSIKFQVDDKKPTLEITSYNSKPVVEADKTAGVKFYVIPQNIYVVKGTYSDKDESGKEGSGVEAVYYCVGTVPEGKVSATWSLASLTNDGWTVSLTDLNSDSLSIKDGSAAYKLHVKAIDKAGNESDSAEFIDIYPDENAPAVTVKATAESGKAIYDETPAAYTNDLAFGKTYYSTGTYTLGGKVTENALQSFKINGSDVAVGTDGTWNYTPTLAEDSSVTYTFTAIDKAGNSFSNSVVIQKDTTAPVVKLATPKENGLIGNSDMISGTVSDAFEVEKVSYSIKKDGTEISDGSGYVTIGSDNSSWTIPSLRISSEGTFTIEFTGTDKLGNTSTSSPVIFYYDAASPAITEAGETTRTVNSNYKLSGTVVESNGLKEITIKDSFGNASPVTLSATASGNGFRLKTGSTDTYDWEYNLTVSDETNGTHIYTITATDVTENSQRASNIITKTVNVDTNAPEISAVTDKANVYLDVSNYVSISAKAGDESTNGYASGLTGVYYIVTNSNASVPGYNGTNWAAMAKGASSYSANFDITKLSYLPVNSDATLYVYIAAVDNAGNSTVYAKPAAITVDKSAPSIEVEGDLNIQTNVTSITKTVVVKDTNLEDSTPNSTAIALTYVSDESNLGAVPTITFVKDVTGGKEYSVKFTAKNDGSESVVVLKATDANERESKTAKLTAKCDLTAPVVNIAEPASAASTTTIYKNSSNVTVKGSVEENNLKDVKVYLLKDDETVSTLADDNRKVDARTVGARPKDDGTKVNDWTANFVNIADGEYKIVVVASDTYTNSKTETVSYKYVVDMTAPVVNSPVYLKLAETEKKVLNSAYAEQSAVTNGFAVENGKTYYTNGTYTLSGTVTETNFSKVTVKAGDNTPVDKTTATWEFTPSSYEEKSVLYTITATDLAGNIGTYTVYVVYDKTAPEEVAISAPAENDYVESKAISISGTASDNGVGIASVTYTIKKGETQLATNSINVSGGRWSASNISLTGLSDEGSCTLLIDAQDRLGNSIDQLTREFSFDSAAPVVTQTNNADYATVKDFVLEGKITENNGLSAADSIVIKEGSTIIATIPSSSITGTKPNYSWTYTFPETGSVATEGKHTYTIIAKDIAGRTSSVTKEITVDTEKPTVTTVPYTTATVVNYDSSTYVLLNANATDETSKVAAVYYAVTNSTTAPAFKATTAGTTGDNWSVMARTASGYTATANLAELNGGSGITSDSAWYVHIKAVDGAGLVSTETTYGTLNVDIHKPVVTVAEGTSIKSKTTDTNLTVNFADTNPRTVYYTINGGDEKSVSLVDGKFDVPITGMRADGTETNVVVYGKDENNRKSDNVNVSITCDTTNPVVEITSPATDSYLSSSTVTVKGTVVEKNMESLKVSLMKNDSEAYSGSANLTKGQGDNYTWSVTLNGVDDGAYTIKAMATDQYGNNEGTAIKSISSIIDTVAPAVENLTVSSESVNIESQNSAFVVTVSVSDATSGIADTEGVVLYDGSERLGKMTEDGAVYKYTIAEADLLTVLSTGAHTLTVHAKDKAGNENNSVSKTISSDVTAPTLKISGVSPTVTQGDTVYVNGKITVSGNATDETSLGETLTWKIKDGSGTDEGTSGTVDVSGTYATWNFTVDTTKLTDNSDYTIEVSVADKAGNKPDSTDSSANTLKWGIKVNQTTDKPVLALTSASEKFAQFSEINGTEKDGQTNILALSGKLTGTVSDDDGISSIVVTVTPEKGSETNYKLVEDGTSTNVSINKTLSELGITAEGAYEINISVTDTKNETKNSSIESNFVVAADNGAPTLAITSPNNGGYYNNSFAVAGTVTDGSGTVVLTASNVSDKEVSGFTKNKTTFTGTSTAQALSDTVKVKDLADKTSDGGYTLTYTATDRWGQSSSANVMFYKDGKPPVLDNENTSVGGVKTMVAVSGDTENNVAPSWFKDESIKIDGEITESGSGIETVYYWLNKTADTTNLSTASGSANAKNLGSGNWSYSMTISGFYAKSSEMLPANANFNTLTIVAVDFAGNVSNLLSYNVRLDSTKPTLTDGSVKVGFEEDPTTGTASFLANGEKDIYISGEISDEENGSGIDKVIILPFGSTSYDENTDKAVVAEGKFKFTIPNTKVTQSGSVFARIYDVAGNYNDVNLFTITYDNKAPSVVLNKPADADTSTDELELNGTISLAGTASDDYTVSKIEKIQYVKSETAPTSDTTWSDLTGVTITGEYSFTVTGFDTTKLTDGNYYLRAVGVDTAENIGYSDPVKVKIDQDSDRPKIKITNLTGSNGNYNLRQGTRSRISGTVTDDDGIEEFYISESPFTGTGDKPETSTYSSNSGSFTFNPSADVTAKKNVDGEKTVYIYVKDKAGGVFYTTAYIDETAAAAAKYLKNPKIFLNDTAIAETENAKVFKYFSDSISPIVGTVTGLAYKADGTTINAAYNEETGSFDKAEDVNASFIIGGTERQKAKFTIKASDANGIAGMALEISYKAKDGTDKKIIRATAEKLGEDTFTTEQVKGDFTGTGTNNSSDATWTTDLISFEDAATGNATLKVVPYDNSGLSGNGNLSFAIDMTGPTIKVTSPSSTEQVSGSTIPVSGIATDAGGSTTDSIKWYVPKADENMKVAGAFTTLDSTFLASSFDSKWSGELTTTSSNSAWTFNFDGNNNSSFSEFVNGGTISGYYSANDDGIVSIPVYFKSTDKHGNATLYRDFAILYNPDADRPLVTITYPSEADYKEGEKFAILGGTIRSTGTVEIPDGSTSTWKVYMQIADKNGNFNDADKTKASNPKTSGGYGYTVLDGNGLQNAWNYDGNSSTLNFDNDTIKSNTIKNSWWGIPVTKNSTSWYFSLNAQGELNPIATGVTNDIKVRFCGVSANINDSNTGGKVGRWSSVYEIHVDSNIPKYSTAMFRYNSDLASVSSTTNDSALAQKEYVPDMYLKGQWYAYAKITDESSVKVTEVKRGTTKLTYGTDYFVYPEKAGNSGGQSAGSDIKDGENGPYVAYVWIKINPNMTTTQTYTISACDSDGTPNYIYPAFEVNTDNKAPEMTALKDSYDSGAKEIAMTKIRNSNKSVSFSTTATDTGSGFDKLAFYFKRTVGSETTIELPTPKANGSGWENDASSAYVGELTETDSELLADSDANELYGVNLTGTTSGSTFTVTSPADISSYKFIRKGGLIKLSGVYYVISDVSGNAITVVENLTTSPTSAFVAAAMILDHVSTAETPLWSGNVCTIAGDEDGDGFIEYIKKSGATWTLQADIFSDLLEDGPVTLVTMAFDKAENVTTTTTDLMIANNAPRLAKVYLATDLNGDTKFTDNELGSSLIKNENTTQKFYSALTNGTEGNVQEVVTISANNDGVNTGITMRDTLGVAFEWVSGYEGYGSGNGDIYYKLGISNAAIDKPASGTTAPIADMSSSFDTTVGSVTASVSTAKLKGLTVTPATVKATSYTEYVSEKEATASNPKNEAVNFINLTLWDSTKGTTAGTGDTVSGDKITKFGSQYTVLNIPLYMDLVDGAKPTPKFSSLEAESATTGHVDLSDTLPSTYFKDTNTGLFDRDSKASGKVVFTGTVNDEKRITELNLKTSKTFANGFTTANSNVKVAEFKDGSLVATTAATSNSASWKFEITKEQFTTAEGHTVNWKLTVDTSKVAGIANSDVKFTITANDGTNNESAEYQVDVVPYITKVSSSKAYYRTMFGNYSVFKGDTLTVKGYNLGNPAVSEVYVGENQKVTPNGGGDDYFTFVVPEYSGSLFVNVSGVRSLNDMNNNKELSNREAKSDDENATTDGGVDYYDERYIYVWDKNHQFKSADDNAHKPVMTSDYDGNLFAAWTLMGAGQQQIERKLTNDSIRVMQHYDQPNEFSAIGIDKTKSGGAISSLVINENVGDGGVMTNNGFSHVSNCGGAFGISIDNAVTVNQNDTSANADKKSPKIANNPFTILDSNWSTSGYSLSSYAMLRDSGKFSTPRTARYGDNMHYVYYNSKNQSLRYTYVKSGSSTATYVRNGNLTTESWIILDGNNSGYDRFHDFVNTTGNLDLVGVAPSSSTANSVTIRAANWSGKIKTGADISVAMAYTYNNINKVVCYDVTGVTWNGNNVTLRFSETYELGTSKPDSVTVYTGAKSLASGTGSATQSSNAGKFASLDLTSTGIPVVAYYDGKNSRLRISYANSATPTETANWVRKDVMYKAKTTDATATQYARGGSHCSLKVDKDGNIHILYRDNKNQLAYIKGTGSVTTGFEFSIPEVIDDNTTGTYGTLSLINGSQPAVAYLNAEESETGIKYALRKEFKFEDDAASSVWDVMVVPVTEGYNPVGENLISCESNNGNWTATEDSVAMKDVTSVIGYQTTRMDVAFLKSEK